MSNKHEEAHREIDVLARTIWGEARGEPLEGKAAVANVILNRAKIGGWWGDTIAEVCRFPWQFSCWNEGDPNLEKLKNVTSAQPVFLECWVIAELAMAECLKDQTDGATHYMTVARREKGWPRDWGDQKTPCAHIGAHIFFNDVK